MKRSLQNIWIVIAGFVFLTSCLNGGVENPDPTYEEEQALLQSYLEALEANNRDIDTTALGVYYIVLEEGEGPLAKNGDTLEVGYSAYFIDGRLFDTSQKPGYEDATIEMILGKDNFIAGWNDMMKVMNKNAKVQCIIPSDLAYGSRGMGIIPPYTTLVFVIKLVDIKPANM